MKDDDWTPEDLYEEVQEPVVQPARSFLSEKPRKISFLSGVLFSLAAAAASVVSWTNPEFKQAWIGNPGKIFMAGEWWRVLTSILLHSDMEHLLSNLLFVIPFAGLLTNYFGWKVFPGLSLTLGILTQAVSLKTYGRNENLLGASGFLYVLFGLWLALYFRAETQLRWTNRLMRVVGFGLVMFIPQEFQPNVSYRTHFIGLTFGLLAGWIYGRLFLRKELATPTSLRRHPIVTTPMEASHDTEFHTKRGPYGPYGPH